MTSPADVASIERATLDAVCPTEVHEIPGWLLPYDPLPIGRAQSAVPLAHAPLSVPALRDIEAHYQQRSRPTVFRLPEGLITTNINDALHAMGYFPHHGVLVQVAELAVLLRMAPADAATLSATPSAPWASVYTADGFDPVDGANRVQLLSRSRHGVYAHASEDGEALAAGTGSISHGWLSIHGMRTVPSARGRGLASRILAGLAAHAAAQGVHRVFLQVEDDNPVAQGLYRKAGFTTAWRYHYWRVITEIGDGGAAKPFHPLRIAPRLGLPKVELETTQSFVPSFRFTLNGSPHIYPARSARSARSGSSETTVRAVNSNR